ncbi:thiamine ABC transporter ATP-binding protein [Pseudoponticoccus marisrubri]|uniref:Thiamine ABC transporter ATP-binding protein n=1 Tax=Pseudoponticoccus marisrubri TaxID=1685382 RepID=A0A0W7WPQ2_9RHOB|nr:ATP-binding cassette domain-containing protein [Pseudoponticoccus marisrubri]KUF12574.1 thiamine ABC transporter ATP-binding protein [Pseudoponticoccus marisrubri]
MLTLEGVRIAMEGGALAADFSLSPGRRVAVLGASGAGKSTLLDAVAGFRALEAGRIRWDGQDLTGLPPDRRPVSILFQDGNLFPHLDLARNLGLALRPDGRRPDRAQAERIEGALARVGLQGLGARKPGTLSGGQQGRAALARVLLQARPILALDEPFAALGPALKAEMLELVREVAEGLGALVLMVTHDPGDAGLFADDIVLVADGAAHAPVPTGAFLADPPAAFRSYVGSPAPERG